MLTDIAPAMSPALSLAQAMPSRETLVLERARRHLHPFVEEMWQGIEPKSFSDGKHLQVICEHLEAVHTNQIRHLIICVPPRHTKSLTVSVFFPAWVWTKTPSARFMCSSYSDALSTRDSVRMRRLLEHPKYKRLIDHCKDRVPDFKGFKLRADQNQKTRYDTSAGGYRLATTVCGSTTGEGGDYIIIDDPHNVLHTRPTSTELRLEEVTFWWDEVMGTRQDDARTGHFIIIMQRVHERDLVGHIMDRETNGDWTILNMPARYEGQRQISFTNLPKTADDQRLMERGKEPNRVPSVIGTRDWRSREGDVLWPERVPDVELKKLEARLGVFGTAGQLQQRPSPRGGGFFQVENFKVVAGYDATKVVKWVRYWDKASTDDAGAYTAGVLIGRYKDGRYIIADVVRGQWEKPRRELRIRQVAVNDGKSVEVDLEQEAGGGGKESAQDTVRNLAGFNVRVERAMGNKEVRATPYATQVDNGNVDVLRAEWTGEFILEHEKFPAGRYKDQVDSSSGGFNRLVQCIHLKGTW